MKRIYFTVTNDLNFDQRMQRICGTLAVAGYDVTLVGRNFKSSSPLNKMPFKQQRLNCFYKKGFLFYAEYNLRLFFFLLFKKSDAICAIDLDTIVPAFFISKLKRIITVYDAHELFCEMKEVINRPLIHSFWKWIERKTVPHFKYGYTVNTPIKEIFQKGYDVNYSVIRNLPYLQKEMEKVERAEPFIIYQGAVNHGRSFENLIPAFLYIDCPLHIYGDGNYLEDAKELVQKNNLQKKVIFKGKVLPEALRKITPNAILGVTLFENNGLNNYLSLANRFFDYIQAGIPQLCVNYPAYKEINDQYNVAIMIDNLEPGNIANIINDLLSDSNLQNKLRQNCKVAREQLNWQKEEKKLLQFYQNIFLND